MISGSKGTNNSAIDKNKTEFSGNTEEKSQGMTSEDSKKTITSHVGSVSKDLNTPCAVHNDVESITNEKAKKAIKEGRDIKGWWDKDGVHLYMPNIHSRYEAEKAITDENFGMWSRVKAMFNNALRAVGLNTSMNLNDVRYAIWLLRVTCLYFKHINHQNVYSCNV